MENDKRTLILPPTKTTNQPTPNEIRLLKIKRENLEMINISQDDVDFIMQEIQKNQITKNFENFWIFYLKFQAGNFFSDLLGRYFFLDIPFP